MSYQYPNDSTGYVSPTPCAYCGGQNGDVYHYGGMCSRVKAIEYFPNGAVKRVEFWDDADSIDPAALRNQVRVIIHEEIGKQPCGLGCFPISS